MGPLRAILFFPFKLIDEGLDFLVFRVLFHRRLWIVNVPLFLWACFTGYEMWSASRAPQEAGPEVVASSVSPSILASPSPRVGSSPEAGVPPVSPETDPEASADPRVAPDEDAGGPGAGSDPSREGPGPGPDGVSTPGTVAGAVTRLLVDGEPSSVAPVPVADTPGPEDGGTGDLPGGEAGSVPGTESPATDGGTGSAPVEAGDPVTKPVPSLTSEERVALRWLARVSEEIEGAGAAPPAAGARSHPAFDGLEVLLALTETGHPAIRRRLAEGRSGGNWRWAVAAFLNGGGSTAVLGQDPLPPLTSLEALLGLDDLSVLADQVLAQGRPDDLVWLLEGLASQRHVLDVRQSTDLLTRMTRWRRGVLESAGPALARIQEPSLLPVIAALMDRHEGGVQAGLARALVASGGSVPETWRAQAMRSPDNAIRAHAILCLAGGAVTAVQVAELHEVAEESDHRVRHAASRILLEAADPIGLAILGRDLASPVPTVKRSVLATLSELGPRYRVESIRQLLKLESLGRDEKLELIGLVAESGHPAGVSFLAAWIEHRNPDVRRTVLDRMSRSDARELAEILRRRLENEEDPLVRDAIAVQLGPDHSGSRAWMLSRMVESGGTRGDLARVLTRGFREMGSLETYGIRDPDHPPLWVRAVQAREQVRALRREGLGEALVEARATDPSLPIVAPWDFRQDVGVSPEPVGWIESGGDLDGDLGGDLGDDLGDLGDLGL